MQRAGPPAPGLSACFGPARDDAGDRTPSQRAPLRNPVNDVRAVAATLKEVGFDVIELENAGQREMARAITRFGEKLADGGVGLFYYSGHGLQVRGRNFLVPVDAEIGSENSVR